ncbi:trehalose-6-phosphate synthase [Devosia sp. PTR5]|uniref:Trehalose-6-phosphate synthase n=1 Tax=Devosia oryzisoli TaxID=2774138 RepID=A0A927IRN2_9HYPH|nr:trehalose-6-phosphate synthase [Devosia oryzisoli]MBD8063886.1 trehalose-6-phosphate synthase [Devosia oryzisoli]
MSRIVIVSNRTPGKGPAAGGLAVALRKVLADQEGFWFGWSGKLTDDPSPEARIEDIDGLSVAQIDLTRDDHHAYYAGFSNSILWPSFHLRLDLATIESHWYEGYRRVNAQFARALKPLLKPDDIVWVHDYHLIPLATELRSLGARNRMGFYLHIPFPTADALYAIPHHAELMRDLSRYDLVGMQANRDVAAFTEFADHQAPSTFGATQAAVDIDFSGTEIAAFPIGSDPDAFARLAASPAATKMIHRMRRVLADQRLVLGVDRLDYSKGLPQRVEAYEKLLANNPRLRRTVHMLQVAPPSRDSIKEYQEIGDTLDAMCGRVMGRFAEPDWQPLTYVKRAYGQPSLAGLYRLARVGLVTPLRDGMNLVAHEFVGSQDPQDPGVLVLSRFAGAAEIFPEALQVNPFDTDETAEALRMALDMPLDERRERWGALMAAARRHNVDDWASSFLQRLSPGMASPKTSKRDILYLASVA